MDLFFDRKGTEMCDVLPRSVSQAFLIQSAELCTEAALLDVSPVRS